MKGRSWLRRRAALALAVIVCATFGIVAQTAAQRAVRVSLLQGKTRGSCSVFGDSLSTYK
jgi:hypothetical protein